MGNRRHDRAAVVAATTPSTSISILHHVQIRQDILNLLLFQVQLRDQLSTPSPQHTHTHTHTCMHHHHQHPQQSGKGISTKKRIPLSTPEAKSTCTCVWACTHTHADEGMHPSFGVPPHVCTVSVGMPPEGRKTHLHTLHGSGPHHHGRYHVRWMFREWVSSGSAAWDTRTGLLPHRGGQCH